MARRKPVAMSAKPKLIASADAILKIAVRRCQRKPPRPLQELLRKVSPNAAAAADRVTYSKFVFMMMPLTEFDTANVFHALTVPFNTDAGLVCHNTAEFFKAVSLWHVKPELVAAELLQMGPPYFTFPFWDRSAFANLVVAWRQGYQAEFPIDIVLELPWLDKSDKFRFLEQVCNASPCVSALGMWQQDPGRVAAYDGEEEAAKEYPYFLRPALLQALDDAYPVHADEVGELLEEPVTKYPKSMTLVAAASGRCRREMAIAHIRGSLVQIMAEHPVHQALTFLQEVFDEDFDAILITLCDLVRTANPVLILRAFQICQALKALPVVLGSLSLHNSFLFHAFAVDSGLLETAYLNELLKEQLADIHSESLLRTIRDYLEFQVTGIPSMRWSESTKTAILDALPKLPALLSSVPRLPALFSLAHGASTRPASPLNGTWHTILVEICDATREKADRDLWKWRDNPRQMKHYLLFEFNEYGTLEVQKDLLNSGNAKRRVVKLSLQQRAMIDEILGAIDRADEARQAGFSNEEIWALHKIQLTRV